MVPVRLLVLCLVSAGAYLAVVSVLLGWVERALRLREMIPPALREETGVVWSMMNLLMEGLFFVVIPSLAFAFFYVVLPVTGVRAGLAAAVFAFTIGAAPALMGLAVRVRLPMTLVLFSLLSLFVKLGGSLAIIGYLYSR